MGRPPTGGASGGRHRVDARPVEVQAAHHRRPRRSTRRRRVDALGDRAPGCAGGRRAARWPACGTRPRRRRGRSRPPRRRRRGRARRTARCHASDPRARGRATQSGDRSGTCARKTSSRSSVTIADGVGELTGEGGSRSATRRSAPVAGGERPDGPAHRSDRDHVVVEQRRRRAGAGDARRRAGTDPASWRPPSGRPGRRRRPGTRRSGRAGT